MDDGPFRGRARADCDALGRAPDHVYALDERHRLETFDRADAGESATVLLREGDGGVTWCAFADGFEAGGSASIRRDEVRSDARDA